MESMLKKNFYNVETVVTKLPQCEKYARKTSTKNIVRYTVKGYNFVNFGARKTFSFFKQVRILDNILGRGMWRFTTIANKVTKRLRMEEGKLQFFN